MSYFVFDGVLECGRQYELNGEEAGHILKSRRLRVEDHFLIQDKRGQRFEVVLKKITRNTIKFVPEKKVEVPPPSPLQLEILLALPKEKALNFILQKATELGVHRLDLFGSLHSSKVLNTQSERQMVRWKRIALEASKQCGRQFPPKIYWHTNLDAALSILPECPNSWVLSPGAENSFSWNTTPDAIREESNGHQRVLVGPEGGFHPDEMDMALSAGMCPADLGPRILRVETAALTAVAILQFLCGDLSQKK